MWTIVWIVWVLASGVFAAKDSLVLLGKSKIKYCATNETDRAVVWDTPLKTEYGKVAVDYVGMKFVNIGSEFSTIDSLKAQYGFVLDNRWESFPLVVANSTKYGPLNFVALTSMAVYDNFEIPLSVRAEKEAHIYVCQQSNGNEPPKADCVWFMLGGWNGSRSGMRVCKRGQISPENKTPSGSCEPLCDTVQRNPLIADTFIHFILKFSEKDNTISLLMRDEEKPLLSCTVDDYNFSRTHDKIWVNSRVEDTAFWKVHKYKLHTKRSQSEEFLAYVGYLNNVCVSLYVKSCEDCTVELILKDAYEVLDTATESGFNDKAGFKKMSMYYSGNRLEKRLYINLKSPDAAYLAFHRLSVTDCSTNPIKISSLETTSEQSCRYLLEPREEVIPLPLTPPDRYVLDCPLNTFGPYCASCVIIDKSLCSFSKICQYASGLEFCYCGVGSTGNSCQQLCPSQTYGQDCKEKCGKCKEGDCDKVTGRCQPCLKNYQGPECKTAILPVINEPPKQIADCYTECDFSVNASSYNGVNRPANYKIQYSLNGRNWVKIDDQFPIKKEQFLLTKLLVSQFYQLRIILYTEFDNYYEGREVPVMNFTTSCREIVNDNVNVSTSERSALIQIENENNELCSYYLKVRLGETLIYNLPLDFGSNNVNGLTPFTEYNYQITKNEKVILDGKFITQEAAPGEVGNVDYNSTSDMITVSWQPPREPNGIITGYNIFLKHDQFDFCKSREYDPNLTRNLTVAKAKCSFENLHPASSYVISISAINSRVGEPYILRATTSTSDKLIASAFGLNVAKAGKVFGVELSLTYNCTLVSSEFTMEVNITCEEAFANCPIKRIFSGDFKPFRVELRPFVNYTFRPTVFNEAHNESVVLSEMYYKTPPKAPNDIENLQYYDMDDKFIWFKFSPPFPPTGEIEKYHLKITQWYTSVIYDKQIKTETCKIWKWLTCFKTPALIYDKYFYFELKAKNKGVNDWSNNFKIDFRYVYKAPDIPVILNSSWDEFYNLSLTWRHPDHTYGILKYFYIDIDKNSYEYQVDAYNYTYNYTIQMSESDAPNLTMALSCSNKQYRSLSRTLVVNNPPPRPKFNLAPQILGNVNGTVKVRVLPVESLKGSSNLYIIISKDKEDSDPVISQAQTDLIKKWLDLPADKTAWFTYFTNLSPQQDVTVLIGTGLSTLMKRINEEIENRKLPGGIFVDIYLVATNERFDLERLNYYTVRVKTDDGGGGTNTGGGNYLIYASLLFLLIPIIALMIYIRKKKISFPKITELRNESTQERRPLTSNNDSAASISIEEPKPAFSTPNGFSKPVNLADFQEYVKASVFDGELARQHALFPRGEQKPNDYGKLPQNKSKNRYMNLVAYNHSRVKLNKLPGDPYSDYINANYIKGLKSPKAYIATQGPKPNTLNDFWRMIWQENVANIAMLANVYENGKKKTEQYWPNYNEEIDFGDINVRHVSTETFADYEIRSFTLKSAGEERKLQQMHFNTWPDHGVPLYPQTLMPFVRRILTFPHDSKPIVVHCSAGVGRTGTIILIDLALRMAAQMGFVDILSLIYQIREQRANMVDNIEQYKLAHLVILECLFSPDTSIRCNETFEEVMRKTIENDLKKQMEYIKESAWQENAISPLLKKIATKRFPEKDRFPGVDVENYGLIYLPPYPSTDEGSVYINAVNVDGFRSAKRFIATQNPLPNTIGDFWRLVVDNDVDIVVSLQEIDPQEPTCCEFVPSESQKVIEANAIISVHHASTKEINGCEVVSVSLHYKDVQRKVKIVNLKGWRFGEQCAPDRRALLAAWEQMNNLSWNENKVVVTCRDGISASGFYLAMAFTLEKIKLEQVCDVCHAVRVIRRSRRQFMQTEEQFVALYEIVFLYLSEFELYSNFGAKPQS